MAKLSATAVPSPIGDAARTSRQSRPTDCLPSAFKKATNFGNAVIVNSRVHDYVIVIHQIYYDMGNMFEIRSVVSNQY